MFTDDQRRQDFRVGDLVRTHDGRVRCVRTVRKTTDGTLLVTVRIVPGQDRVYSSLPTRHAGYPLSRLNRICD